MKIEAWSVEPAEFENLDPDWRYGDTHVPRLAGVFVALRAEDGTLGEGYAPVLGHLGRSQGELVREVESLAAACVGGDARQFSVNAVAARRSTGISGPALSALDMALHDLAARIAGIPVSLLLGGRHRERIPVVRIVPIKPPREMAAAAAALVERGYRAVKLKATGELDDDLARVGAVRAAIGEGPDIYVDPNQAYDVDGAIRFCRNAAELGVSRVEQPVPARDRDAMARVARELSELCVEADERLFTPADLVDVLERRAAHGVCLKLTRSGGIAPTLAMAGIAEGFGVKARMSTAFGGALVSLAAAEVAASLGALDGYAEVGEFDHFHDTCHHAPKLVEGSLLLGAEPGFGQRRKRAWSAPWRA
ncbi:mandelate racemase/muconate lactonizing enzyme family protein [Lutibaculum baratangense]|uniref:Mandelate racemase/muconate lactonizing enzyme C-terminal domain-containing protein n=1 Tax=Lutibaculum baratangense AMV1 TaxID=631454 RepID=V4RCA7_9HYPH|nr:mandelate racemase/muconate lactonizing enzyme family protein [Lutibaculum baratangense]ESR23014.1 hypothetical protein N177_3082 [Lutibaculum baratangense AMV1]